MSSTHVTVLDIVEVLLQASLAVKVIVCDLLHVPVAAGVDEVIVSAPHASVAVAKPNAPLISEAEGLHPSGTSS